MGVSPIATARDLLLNFDALNGFCQNWLMNEVLRFKSQGLVIPKRLRERKLLATQAAIDTMVKYCARQGVHNPIDVSLLKGLEHSQFMALRKHLNGIPYISRPYLSKFMTRLKLAVLQDRVVCVPRLLDRYEELQ